MLLTTCFHHLMVIIFSSIFNKKFIFSYLTLDFKAYPIEKLSANPNIALVVTKYGGHISFVEGLCPTGCNFACRILKDYLSNILIDIKSENTTPFAFV